MSDFSFSYHSHSSESFAELGSLKSTEHSQRRIRDLEVTITNVTSYIGAHLCLTLLKYGVTVKGTVTNFEHNSALHELHEKLT